MPNILSIANQKGGVGKTTTAINLSSALSLLNKRVLLIDLDPQGNATMGCGIDKYTLDNSICEVLLSECNIQDSLLNIGDIQRDVVKHNIISHDIIAANTDLIAAEVKLVKTTGNEFVLKQKLSSIQDNYDFIIIDCPPALNMLTVNAFSASNGIIIPMQCEYYALEGLSSLMDTITSITKNINPDLTLTGIVRTMFDTRTKLANEISMQLTKHFTYKLFKTIIPRNIKLAESPSFGQSVLTYAKHSKGAISYMALANELLCQN